MKNLTRSILKSIPTSLFCTLFFILGIITESLSFSFLSGIMTSFLGLSLFLYYRKQLLLFLIPLFFLLGNITYSFHRSFYEKECSSFYKNSYAKIIANSKTSSFHWPYVTQIRIEPTHFYHYFFPYTFLLYSKKPCPFLVDDLIFIPHLEIKKPEEKEYREYLFKEKCSGATFASFENISLHKRKKLSFKRAFYETEKRIIESLKKKLSNRSFGLFCSLFLSEKYESKYQLKKNKEIFSYWGISHQLARSGIHLLIFLLLLTTLLNFVPLSFTIKQFICLLIVSFYFFITPTSISFLRAFYIFLIAQLSKLTTLSLHSLHIFSIVTLVILCLNPFQLFFLDFQLSFYITFALTWLSYVKRQKLF